MPRIPQAELERLKQTVSVQRLVESAGIALKRHGKNLIGRCPFHDDKTPSLIVTPGKNLWHCLGACNTGGSVIDWAMKRNGISFRHAVDLLRNDPSLAASSSVTAAKRSRICRLDAPVTPAASDPDALNQVIGYYHETLMQNAEALAYLAKRGIKSDEMISRFKLGYANRTLAYRLPAKHTKEGAAVRGRLQRLGVLRESGHEHFNGSLVIPICDEAGNVVLHVQPATKSLGLAIRKSVWLGKGQAPAITTQTETAIAAEAREALHDAEKSEPPPPSLVAKEVVENESTPLPASPVPPAPSTDVPAEVKDEEVIVTLGDRRYRIRGLAKNLAFEVMKVNVLASRADTFHVDTFDLYSARHRASFIHQAAHELGLKEDVIKKDLARVLLKLEQLREALIKKTLAPKEKPAVVLDETSQRDALALLKEPKLLDRLLADFECCGVVGEQTNKLAGYLAVISRKLDKPLAVIVQSTSAAGKSSLMDACLAFVPEEERIQYSAMTGQSLYYMGGIDLKHKVLALAEEQGAARAAYALKLLQSEGRLTIASTAKDPETGRLETQTYTVEGPVMIFMTTTAIDIDDELLNRCLVLSVDEDRAQTRAIHQLQREAETLEGLIAKEERSHLLKLHQNAQRLLKPLYVVNPYARCLTFPDTATRTRRDQTKYLALIRAIALLHQHQRPIKATQHRGETKEYVEVTLDDIEIANRLAHEVLGRTLDELPPQTRRLLLMIEAMVRAACARLKLDRADYRFSRREVREATGTTTTGRGKTGSGRGPVGVREITNHPANKASISQRAMKAPKTHF